MYARSVIFLSCLSKLIIVTNGGDPVYIDPGMFTDEDVGSLIPISAAVQALPIILFQDETSSRLVYVTGLIWAEVNDGRLATGTKFYSRYSEGTQFFFCPKSEVQSSEQCLAPMKFDESQSNPLQCEDEPIPTVLDANKHCGSKHSNRYLKFIYEICPAEEPYTYRNDPHTIYVMCYDTRSEKILFVFYTFIGAGLLEDKLFTREREIEFEMNTENYGHIDPDYHDNLSAEIQQKRGYVLQQLVPTDDMALATSRKTTEYFANFALLHGALFNVWNEIIKYFRDHAIANKDEIYTRLTGVIDIPENEITFPVDENQKMNIWYTTINYYDSSHPEKVAVLMNNFIINGRNNRSAGKFIDKLCGGENHCQKNLKKKFNDAGVQGRCCRVTEIISRYSEMEFTAEGDILHVKNITYI